MTPVKFSIVGTTLNTNPEIIPQNAACFVMVRLQTLMKPTGPQDDANTVPTK